MQNEQSTASSNAPSWPEWFATAPQAERDLSVSGPSGEADLYLCRRGKQQLVVTFGHGKNEGHPEQDWSDWVEKHSRARSWSHLSIVTRADNRFRDAALIADLVALKDSGFFQHYEQVCFFGSGQNGTGFAALAFAGLCPGAVVLSIQPHSTSNEKRIALENRDQGTDDVDEELSYSDVADSLAETSKVYAIFDPFERQTKKHVDRLPDKRITKLRGFGMGDDPAVVLRRLGCMRKVFDLAVAGELDRARFYNLIRGRKNLYVYRINMEKHLKARKKTNLLAGFTKAFKQRARQNRSSKRPERTALPPMNMTSPTPIAPSSRPGNTREGRWPRTLGNVWDLRDDGTVMRYLSDQFLGQTIGFTERDGVTLADTSPLALGIAALGHGAGIARDHNNRFEWHVFDETMQNRGPYFAAQSHGAIVQMTAAAKRVALRTVVATTVGQTGITDAEALPDSALYKSLIAQIKAAQNSAKSQGKKFFLDRVCLSLLAGSPQTKIDAASRHYARVATAIHRDIATAIGQRSAPQLVVSQSAGTIEDGQSEVILAEGQLDMMHPALGFVVATPKYPFAMMKAMPATQDTTAQVLIDELEAMAVDAIQNGNQWYCPALRQARAEGDAIIVELSTMGDLEFGSGDHGFALVGDKDVPVIKHADIYENKVRLSLDRPTRSKELVVTYAWGATQTASSEISNSANQGSLRETWSAPSVMVNGAILHRYALSGRLRVDLSDGVDAARKAPS